MKQKINKKNIILLIIFIIGILVRTVGIAKIPNGLNCDEASIGYEAYSVMNYGIDRNGKSWPIFLESWGSGQNALYMYTIMPFIKIFGLNTFSVRFPMAIIGCISLWVIYKLLSKFTNEKFTIIGLAFFAITPWHIMKSRYGLESNIFPDLMLWGAYFILDFLNAKNNNDNEAKRNQAKEKKEYKFYIGAILLALCGYAYGTSYFFLPVFVLALLITLFVKKKINLRQAIIFFLIIFAIDIPIMLMVIINTFNLNEIYIGKITIPRLESNRYETLTIFSSDNVIKTLFTNFGKSLKMIITQTDEYNANTLEFYGILYVFSIPFTIIGLIKSWKEKENINLIFNIWFISAFLLTFVCEPNINRMNILYIPLIYYTIKGIYEISIKDKEYEKLIALFYIISFISFEITYNNTNFTETYTFTDNVQDVIQYTKNVDADTIYFEYAFKEPYIYILFYNKVNPHEYIDTVQYNNEKREFDRVKGFGKYKFYIPSKLNDEENNCYVIKKEEKDKLYINENIWKTTEIDDFLVIQKR